MSAILRITVVDIDTGDTETVEIPAGEYYIVTTKPCRLDRVQAHANGTHVLTVKDRIAR